MVGVFCWGEGIAQDLPLAYEPMVTDRPDVTESASIVPRKYLQVEAGGYFESFRKEINDYRTKAFNTTLIRYGLLDNLELRLGWDYLERINRASDSARTSQSGLSPLLLGVKVPISDQVSRWPAMALLAHLSLPFLASSDFRPATTGVDLRFAFSHTLSEKSSLGYNIGAAMGGDAAQLRYLYSLSYGYTMTSVVGFYVELYGNLPELGSADHYWDLGATYLLLPNLQLDITLGRSITQGQDLLLSTGISLRIPD